MIHGIQCCDLKSCLLCVASSTHYVRITAAFKLEHPLCETSLKPRLGTHENFIMPSIQNMFQYLKEHWGHCYASIIPWIRGISLLEDGG